MNEHFKEWKEKQFDIMKKTGFTITEHNEDEFSFSKMQCEPMFVSFQKKLTDEMKRVLPETLFSIEDKIQRGNKYIQTAYSLHYGTKEGKKSLEYTLNLQKILSLKSMICLFNRKKEK